MGRPKGASEPLSAFTDDQRRFYLTLRAREVGRARALRVFYEAYPDAKQYSATAFINYEQSDLGKEALEKLAQGVSEQAVQVSFAQRGIRVQSLVDVARVLIERLYDEDRKGGEANAQVLVKYASEFRSTLSAIREEVDPLSASDTRILSSFEAFFRERERMFSDPTRKKIGGISEWSSQTPETQEN